MERLISDLRAQAQQHPNNLVLRRLLEDLDHLLNNAQEGKYDRVQRDLGMLAAQGLWEPNEEDEELLRGLREKVGLGALQDPLPEGSRVDDSKSAHPLPISREHSRNLGDSDDRKTSRDISIVQPPPLSTPLLPISSMTPTVLPVELVQTLNHTFFLHLLATDPDRVLPPGKSLLSTMSAPSKGTEGEHANLEDRVKDLVHGAFWKEALESLSNPSPATQLPRLQGLYEDLHAALKPLLPQNHSILITLSLPLSPTSAPLRSAVIHIREILVALRKRCSPARDVHIDKLLHLLDEPNQLTTIAELAKMITDTTRAILEVAEDMKEDLSQFVLGTMDEKDLKVMITQQAMLREKALILQLWPPSRTEPEWKVWVDELDLSMFPGSDTVQPSHRRWSYRLVQALGSSSPVNCPLPTTGVPDVDSSVADDEETQEAGKSPNLLPPPFFVTCPALLTAQNYLQALVIAASLRTLVRLPLRTSSAPSSHAPSAGDGPASFTQRIWTLLKAEVDEEPGAEDTKLINLADEVVRVRRSCAEAEHPCGPEEEARLRAAVDRTLQPRDPVFLLLQKRLLQGLGAWLVSGSSVGERAGTEQAAEGTQRTLASVNMQTGRDRPGKRPRLHLGLEESRTQTVFAEWRRERSSPHDIRGFEDEVLVHAVSETFQRVASAVDWTDRIWPDLIETGEIGGSSTDSTSHLNAS